MSAPALYHAESHNSLYSLFIFLSKTENEKESNQIFAVSGVTGWGWYICNLRLSRSCSALGANPRRSKNRQGKKD